MKSEYIIVIVFLVIVVILYEYNKRKENFVSKLDIYGNSRNIDLNNWYKIKNTLNKMEMKNKIKEKQQYYKHKNYETEEYTEGQFHQDYIDVIDAFSQMAPNNKQLFNINNYPCKTTKDQDIEYVRGVVGEFIDAVNEIIYDKVNVERANVQTWKPLLEQKYNDGFQKVQKELGLPEKLYNASVAYTKIKFVEFSNIFKYEIEDEVKYVVEVVISREESPDKMLFKLHFIYNKALPENIITERINVEGFISRRGTDAIYNDINDYYKFDSLDDHNMLNIDDIMGELDYKYKVRTKLMQDRVNNLHPDDKYMHMYIDPEDYATYENVQTIYDDVYGKFPFDQQQIKGKNDNAHPDNTLYKI